MQRDAPSLGDPGILPERLRGDHGISAAEAGSIPGKNRPGAQTHIKDHPIDCTERPAEELGAGKGDGQGAVLGYLQLCGPLPFRHQCWVEHSNSRVSGLGWREGFPARLPCQGTEELDSSSHGVS